MEAISFEPSVVYRRWLLIVKPDPDSSWHCYAKTARLRVERQKVEGDRKRAKGYGGKQRKARM